MAGVRMQRNVSVRGGKRPGARAARNAGRHQAAGLAGLGVGASAAARRAGGAVGRRGAGVVAMAAKGKGPNEMQSFMTYLSTPPVLLLVVGYVVRRNRGRPGRRARVGETTDGGGRHRPAADSRTTVRVHPPPPPPARRSSGLSGLVIEINRYFPDLISLAPGIPPM